MNFSYRDLIGRLVAVGGLLLCAAPLAAGSVLYVDDDAEPGGDGQSWETAFRFLQDALDAAQSPGGPGAEVEEIHVAQGLYLPDRDEENPEGTGDRTATFVLIEGLALMGGYAGIGAPDPDARDIDLYETILSGDLLGDDEPEFVNNEENSYHVVTALETDGTAVLDGLTITAGNAGLDAYPHRDGAGLFAEAADLLVSRCTFLHNRARERGGGMCIRDSAATIDECRFTENRADSGEPSAPNRGGGLHLWDSVVSVIACSFVGNSAYWYGEGGALHNLHSITDLLGCTFEENAALRGGAVYVYLDSLVADECSFVGNVADNGGGLFLYVGVATVTGSIFIDNVANDSGGCVFTVADLMINDSSLIDNTALIGGAIYADSGVMTLLESTLTSNFATAGGAVSVFDDVDAGVSGCAINGNLAGLGGGIYVENASLFSVESSMLAENAAALDGGAVYAVRGTPALINCTVAYNEAREGAGLYSQFSAPVVTECTFSRNDGAANGGAILNEYSDATIERCLLEYNEAPLSGGAIVNRDGSALILACRFVLNTAAERGGAIANLRSIAVIDHSVFTSNHVGYHGGAAIANDQSDPIVLDCLFADNNGWVARGSAMYNIDSAPTIVNCTFARNIDGDGAIYNVSSSPTVANAVFWENAWCQINDTDGSSSHVRYSDVQWGWAGEGEGNIDEDPRFVDLWGEDYRLLPDSPCIDAGDNTAVPEDLVTDLDGNPRFVDDPNTEDSGIGYPCVDMGAYEFQVEESCPADFDGDGDVDTSDLLFLLGAWGTPEGDVDGDGDTDTADLLALLAAWGEGP